MSDDIEDLNLDEIAWDDTEWEQTEWEEYVFEKGALRAQERHDERYRVFLNMIVRTPDREIRALSVNVSDGGVFVTTPHRVEPGTIVEMDFKLPNRGETLHLRGEVRWTEEAFDVENEKVPGFGVKFIDLVSEDRYKLFRFVDDIKRSGATNDDQ